MSVGLPFRFEEPITLAATDIDRAVAWFEDIFGLVQTTKSSEVFDACLGIPAGRAIETCICLIRLRADGPSPFVSKHPIVFTQHIENAFDYLTYRNVAHEPIETDMGGNRLFRFRDSEGNALEVCQRQDPATVSV